MLRCTRRSWAIFTQGYPILEQFANEHFLPSNPLSSSCLWLDEDDFRGVTMAAQALGVKNPLRIDPYAHHPTLSRFAVKPSSEQARQQRRSTDGVKADALSSHPPSNEKRDGTVIQDLLETAAAHDAAPQAGGKESVNTTAAVRRKRGRPRKAASISTEPVSSLRATPLDALNYRVPICSLLIQKPLYLFNLDQMFLSSESETQSEKRRLDSGFVSNNNEKELGGDTGSFCDLQERSLSRKALDVNNILDAPSEAATDYLLSSASHGYGLGGTAINELFSGNGGNAVLAGVRALQQKFPEPGGVLSNAVHSIVTRKPYGSQRQRDLQRLARQHNYQSKWWGTRKQWFRVGAMVRPGEKEHVVPISFPTKLVHISLLENASEVLQNSLIAPRQRKVVYIFPDKPFSNEYGGLNAMHEGVLAQETLAVSPTIANYNYSARNRFFDDVQKAVHQDMKQKKYKLPLYLSKHQITSLGLTLRPGEVGVSPTSETSNVESGEGEEDLDSNETVSNVATGALPLKETSVTKYSCWYHISQVHFPASFLIPSSVLSAELEKPGVPLHGMTGVPLAYPELAYTSLVDHHPEIAAVLLTDNEEATTTVARAVQDGGARPSEATTSAAPTEKRVASTITGGHPNAKGELASAEPLDELQIADFVATHASAKLVKGRHLWFTAEDVLAVNGIVDVNSAPVEVHTKTVLGNRIAGSNSDAAAVESDPRHTLYNVECLSDPDEALRKLSSPFEAE